MVARVVIILAVVLLGIVQCKLINSCNITRKFVDGHNNRRLQLAKGGVSGQPAASKMTYLTWDEELAKKASNWASRNKYGHNPDTTIPSKKFNYVGENIYIYKTSNKKFILDPERAMKTWWDEHKDFTFSKITNSHFGKGKKKIGHYTQMAWANTVRVGCGISQFFEDKWNCFLVVCNYAPGGNIIGETPYKANNGASGRLVCGDPSTDCRQKYGDKCKG